MNTETKCPYLTLQNIVKPYALNVYKCINKGVTIYINTMKGLILEIIDELINMNIVFNAVNYFKHLVLVLVAMMIFGMLQNAYLKH